MLIQMTKNLSKPSKETSQVKFRKRIFKQKFNGYNHRELAKELNIDLSLCYHYTCSMKISKKHISY